MLIYFILGIITGLILAIIVFLSIKRYEIPINRTIKQAENKFKEKGEIYIESDEKQDLEAYINNLPKE